MNSSLHLAMIRAFFLVGLSAFFAAPALSQDTPDYTKVPLEKLKIELVAPRPDPKTGFIVGGKNPTSLVRRLTEINGRSIAELEKDMRPGAMSGAGFLGRDESLLEVMARDNEYVVEKLGLTHQDLAKHLRIIGMIGGFEANFREFHFRYHGRNYKIMSESWMGYQDSPFRDGTKTSTDATVWNLDKGTKLRFSLLVPYMIERYGFYEGKGTSYRIEPAGVLAVFDFLADDGPQPASDDRPSAGDPLPPAVWLCLIGAAVIALSAVVYVRVRRSRRGGGTASTSR